jgi:hypothetical protein
MTKLAALKSLRRSVHRKSVFRLPVSMGREDATSEMAMAPRSS